MSKWHGLSRGAVQGAIALSVIVTTIAGCRAAEPARGPSSSSLRVVAGTGPGVLAPSRVAIGRDTSLVPLRDFLRTNVAVRADGLGEVTWGFSGATEEVSVTGPALAHRPIDRAALGAERVGLTTELVDEQNRLAATPVLGAAVPSASLDGLIPFGGELAPPEPPRPFDNFDAVFDREAFVLDPSSIEIRWQQSTPDASRGGATYPVLVIRTRYTFELDEEDYLQFVFDAQSGTVVYEHGIAFRPCRGGRCLTSGALFDAYRTVLTRSGDPETALLPDLGLELIHQVRLVSADVHVQTLPTCILALPVVSPIPIPGAPYAPDPTGAAAACLALPPFIEGVLRGVLADLAGTLDTLGDLLVNPPTFRTDLETVLAAAYDTNGDGQMSGPETRGALEELGFGTVPALTTAVGLTNGCSDGATETVFCPFNAIRSELTLTGSLAADGTRAAEAAPSPLGELDGTFSDRTYDMFARGTLPDVQPTAVRLDLRVIRAMCESGDAPANFDLLCDVCGSGDGPAEFCEGRRIRAYVVDPADGDESFAVPDGAVEPFAVPSVPGVARLLEVAPLFGETLRGFLLNGTAPGTRFTATSFELDDGGRARFEYIIDPDFDGLDSSVDNCPDDANPLQSDDTELVEGRPTPDGVGNACDLCPHSPGGTDARDCDCDADRDGCNNDAPFGPPLACALTAGRVYDRTPGVRGVRDFDADAILDDCDADTDGDGVLDAVDNCPRGDGDAIYEALVDADPSQTDSGGIGGRGDLCDLLCGSPGAPGCSLPVGDGDERIPDGAIPFPGFLPAAACLNRDCGVGLLSLCGGRGLIDCLDAPLGFGSFDLLGQSLVSFGAQTGASVLASGIPDLTGDGVAEVIVSAPDRVGACTPNGCEADVGEVLVVNGSTGAIVSRLSFGEPGSSFGAAVVRSGSLLAIGAPGAHDAAGAAVGAVHVFDTGSGSLVFVATVYGSSAGSRFGSLIAPISTKRGHPQLLIGAPSAGTVVRWDAERGELARFSIGAVGVMSSLLSVREEDSRHGHRGPIRIVVGVPDGRAGAGAVFVFDRRGARRDAIYGRRGERLGAAVLAAEGGPDDLWVGAPGHGGGRGAIVRMSLRGRRSDTLVWSGRALGSSLVETRDLNGDGQRDLLAGFELNGEASTLLVGELLRPRGCGPHRR